MKRHSTITWITTLAALAALPQVLCYGQLQAGHGPTSRPMEEVQTRVYDVRHLMRIWPDYPAASAKVPTIRLGGEAPAPASKPGEPAERAGELIKLIQDTVAPDCWRSNGGSLGSISELGGHLIITLSAENQRAVAALLDQVAGSGVNALVTVRAQWVLLHPDELGGLLKAAGAPANEPNASRVRVAEIDPVALDKLGNKVVRYRAQTTCFNGQTVHVSSGRGRLAVTGLTAVVASGGSAAYNPTVTTIRTGAVLQVTPLLWPDGSRAVVDVHSTVCEWDDASNIAAAPLPAAGMAATRPASVPLEQLDRLNLVVQELETTLRIPVGKPVLVGGMTLEPTVSVPDGRQMYLILDVTGSD